MHFKKFQFLPLPLEMFQYLTPLNLLSVRPFVKITFGALCLLWARRALQPSAGARKKPPVA